MPYLRYLSLMSTISQILDEVIFLKKYFNTLKAKDSYKKVSIGIQKAQRGRIANNNIGRQA